MKRIVRKWLEWYTEHKVVQIEKRYNRFLLRLDREENRLNKLYNKINKWLEKEEDE